MKRGLLATVSLIALTAGAAVIGLRARTSLNLDQKHRNGGGRTAITNGADDHAANNTALTRQFLLYYIVPLWQAAGIADWICHRATDIEHTTGAKESLVHLLMLAEASIPVLAGFFLEITTPVAALMIASFFLHEATALWDVSYAVTRRNVTPIEQHVHSFLEMVPLMAVSFVAVLHWPQFKALIGQENEPADLSIRLKDEPLPPGYVPAALGSMSLFEVLPYLEELIRSLRANNGRLVPSAGAEPSHRQ
jgi:hypothetical protein